MFGYLQIDKGELLVREYDSYKAVYCGLCKQLGKDYSFLARLGLSYDCTFYAMLLMAINKSCSGFSDGHCTCNPLKKCKFAVDKSDAYSKSSAFWILSGYYKIKDNINDNKGIKKFIWHFPLPIFSHWRKKAIKKYSYIEEIICNTMTLQNEVEQNKSSIDKSAHPTANMIGELLSKEGNSQTQTRVLYEFGYQIGRWIYLIDACDDIYKDKKSNSYNPFLNEENCIDISFENINATLNQSLGRAFEAYNLIEINDFKGILDNMILKGFPNKQNQIIKKSSEVINE